MKTKTIFYLAFAVVAITAVVINFILWNAYIDWRVEKNTPTPEAPCEVGVVNPDGSVTINETHAGTFDYTIYATSDGIKVLGDCK